MDGPPPALDQRLIFTVTTGRSGTRFLAGLLRGFPAVDARHEPPPRFSDAFRTVVQFPDLAAEFWCRHKLPAIARSKKPIYAETSHLAGKGFLESLLDLGFRPDLLHLHRPPRAVATSLWRLGTVPGRSYRGVRYYLAPTDRVVLPLPPDRIAGLHDYQLCYWYCLEMAARAARYAGTFAGRGVRVHDLPLGELALPGGIERLGRRLDLGPYRRTRAAILHLFDRDRHNRRDDRKRDLHLPEERLVALEAEVRDLAGPAADHAPLA
ncbi:MAG: hypothetical protein AB1726_17425 [Planctomycetota bacterium]